MTRFRHPMTLFHLSDVILDDVLADDARFFQSAGRARDDRGRDSTDLRLEAAEAAGYSEERAAELLAQAAALDQLDGYGLSVAPGEG